MDDQRRTFRTTRIKSLFYFEIESDREPTILDLSTNSFGTKQNLFCDIGLGHHAPDHIAPAHTARQRSVRTGAPFGRVHTTPWCTTFASAFCTDDTHRAPAMRADAHRAPALTVPHTPAHIVLPRLFHQRLLSASSHMMAHTTRHRSELIARVSTYAGINRAPANSSTNVFCKPAILGPSPFAGTNPGSHSALGDSKALTQSPKTYWRVIERIKHVARIVCIVHASLGWLEHRTTRFADASSANHAPSEETPVTPHIAPGCTAHYAASA